MALYDLIGLMSNFQLGLESVENLGVVAQDIVKLINDQENNLIKLKKKSFKTFFCHFCFFEIKLNYDSIIKRMISNVHHGMILNFGELGRTFMNLGEHKRLRTFTNNVHA